jgi:hypothetical protein
MSEQLIHVAVPMWSTIQPKFIPKSPVMTVREQTHGSDRAPRTHSPICLDLSAAQADPRHCRSPRAKPWLCSPSRWPPRRVVADGRRAPDRAAAADVTDPCADQDRASRRSADD